MLSFFVTPISVPTVFGKLSPPPGSEWAVNPITGLSTIIIFLIQVFLIIAVLVSLFFALWGALDWTLSGGEPDKITAARAKLTNAFLGAILVVVALGLYVVVSTNVLGIIKRGPQGEWIFGLPTINK